MYLIRHGQASFMAENYDVLSQRGIEQSRALGRYFGEAVPHVDAVITGPRQRQIDTATHMLQACACKLPAPIIIEELDEFPFESLTKALLPTLRERKSEHTHTGSEQPPERIMADLLHRMTVAWSQNDYPQHCEGIETYASFCARVYTGLDRIMTEQQHGKRVVVITSGGPISLAVRRALDVSELGGWHVASLIRNASISEFLYSEGVLSLATLNATPHLHHDSITYY